MSDPYHLRYFRELTHFKTHIENICHCWIDRFITWLWKPWGETIHPASLERDKAAMSFATSLMVTFEKFLRVSRLFGFWKDFSMTACPFVAQALVRYCTEMLIQNVRDFFPASVIFTILEIIVPLDLLGQICFMTFQSLVESSPQSLIASSM